MKITEEDFRMASYIWKVLLQKPMIIASWGVNQKTVKPINPLGIEFHVQGFIHKGMVRITLDEGTDTFTISLISDSDKKEKIIEDIFFDELVDVIDRNVEKTKDYQKRIIEEYKISED